VQPPKVGSTLSAIADAEQTFSYLPPIRDGLRLILETALDAVVIMNADGVVADWNDRAPRAPSGGRETKRLGGKWPTSSFLSDIVNRIELDFNDISEAAKGKH
jgi:hypothetical protein